VDAADFKCPLKVHKISVEVKILDILNETLH
jgi:hypothetical protein